MQYWKKTKKVEFKIKSNVYFELNFFTQLIGLTSKTVQLL